MKVGRGILAVDTETTGLDPWHGDRPFVLVACDEDGQTLYTEWPVNGKTREVEIVDKSYRRWKKLLENPNREFVFHNAAFDLRMLESIGIEVRGKVHDTMMAAHTWNSAEFSYGLKQLADKYFGIGKNDQTKLRESIVASRRKAKAAGLKIHASPEADYWLPRHFDPKNRLCKTYAIKDVERTMSLWLAYADLFDEDKTGQLWQTYKFEMEDLFPVVYAMMGKGMAVDDKEIDRLIDQCELMKKEKLQILREASEKEDFNPNSGKQVIELLFNKMGLVPREWTDSDNPVPKTGRDALAEHGENPAVKALLDFRAYDKGLNSFFYVYKEKKIQNEGKVWSIHATLKQSGKRTARFSCSSPNLQQVPDVESSRAKTVIEGQRPFIPRPGYVMYLWDWSQLEVRIFAAMSKEPVLTKALIEGRDFHTETTNLAWGGEGNAHAIWAAKQALDTEDDQEAKRWLAAFDYDIVKAESSIGMKNSRSRGKTLFFARMFGGGPGSIKDVMGVSRAQAKKFINIYDSALPGIPTFINQMKVKGQQKGYIVTAFNRRLQVPDDADYKAASYLVQGTAADLMKYAMVGVDSYLKRKKIDGHLLMTVHDELIMEIREGQDTRRVLRAIKSIMEDSEDYIPGNMPTPVEAERCRRTWAEKEKVELS